jgi:phage-related protein
VGQTASPRIKGGGLGLLLFLHFNLNIGFSVVFLFWYNYMARISEKQLVWIGSSKKDLVELPADVRRFFGHALDFAQRGERHDSAKVLKGFGGAGVLEVVEDDAGGTYRAVYTVKFEEAVFVLHCFQKKSKSGIGTPGKDMNTIRVRLKVAEVVAQEIRDGQTRKQQD